VRRDVDHGLDERGPHDIRAERAERDEREIADERENNMSAG